MNFTSNLVIKKGLLVQNNKINTFYFILILARAPTMVFGHSQPNDDVGRQGSLTTIELFSILILIIFILFLGFLKIAKSELIMKELSIYQLIKVFGITILVNFILIITAFGR